MEKSTKENKVDAFVENAGNFVKEAVDTVRDTVNNASENADAFVNEVKTSETYANIKENVTETAEKAANAGKTLISIAKTFIKSKTSKKK